MRSQQVKTFQRILAYEPVGGTVPPPTAANFSPSISGLYVEAAARSGDLGFTGGLRYDGFSPGANLANNTLHARSTLNPRAAVSTMVEGATFVASVGKFSQPPDLQYLVNSAFDDTTRTGRFRQGNADLGFESAMQYELSVRVRLKTGNSVKVNIYDKRLDGLVASVPINVNPDSSTFQNADIGTVLGAEVIFERELHDGWGVRVSGVVQRAEATVSNSFNIYDRVSINPVTHDTIPASRFQFPLDYDRRLALIAVVTGEINPRRRLRDASACGPSPDCRCPPSVGIPAGFPTRLPTPPATASSARSTAAGCRASQQSTHWCDARCASAGSMAGFTSTRATCSIR